jgi:hypothetical protein
MLKSMALTAASPGAASVVPVPNLLSHALIALAWLGKLRVVMNA